MFLALVELAYGTRGRDERLHDRRVEHAAAGCDLAYRAHELVAVADPVLQQVRVTGRALGQQRDRVLGLVVLREHDDAGAGIAQANELRGFDSLVLEVRGHPDVGDDDLGVLFLGAAHEAVEVLGDADDVEIGLRRQQRPHAFPHEQRVVGEKDGDLRTVGRGSPCSHVPIGVGSAELTRAHPCVGERVLPLPARHRTPPWDRADPTS